MIGQDNTTHFFADDLANRAAGQIESTIDAFESEDDRPRALLSCRMVSYGYDFDRIDLGAHSARSDARIRIAGGHGAHFVVDAPHHRNA